ncbi:PPR domain-containing protein/PPR_2 domain-containing protein/PPR_3 domain-containing protein [Cephalotus follicularis]|uniref:PPR domain-containing protein/PPR_2 domain-containing protein/PPR_3 domain-containing protein n=1 Tax=Cephalotus follicularis TaxID=3775 RepID=A0A1Q3AX20_CEPFO|nr:PPR domain-containing protein/PPR_2 domain-containing protein/PPR_3 domain-containing protein [Cephalotus follicularis]
MDITFALNNQTLITLNSWTTAVSSLYSTKPHSIRRQFFGCSYNLRPPASSKSPRKLKNLRFLNYGSPRFYFKASLDSSSYLLVVSVATFSAISLVFFDQYNKRKSFSEVSISPNFALSRLAGDIVSYIVDRETLAVGDLQRETSATEKKDSSLKINVNSDAAEYKDIYQQFQGTALVHDNSPMTKTLELSNVDCLPSSVLPEFSALHPLIFETEISELQGGNVLDGVKSQSEFPGLRVNIKSSAASIPASNACTVVNKQSKVNIKNSREDNFISYYTAFRESDREELHTFYGKNQPKVKSPSNLNGLKVLSFHTSPLDNINVSSVKRNTAMEGVQLAAPDSLPTADLAEEQVPLASSEGGSSYKRIVLERSRGVLRGKERGLLMPDNDRNSLQFNVARPNDKHPLTDLQSSYNCLLREGRLADCVELIEGMDRRGLLDMNKIYHARFFQLCRSQNAVKEAFRFTKLIPNPTLSTFNMLMSVCASSQDSEGAFQVMRFVHDGGLRADCKLYTSLISTCAKSGKVDVMFKVFHDMVNAGVEPNVHTYGALIDGCARAGQVAKAFGAYGIMRSKNVKPDRVVFNALITACGQSGAVHRAFDVLAEMRAETQPIDPDHVTVGALMKACANAGQIDRAQDVYKMIHEYDIKGTPEVYTIALNCCSQTGDWDFASSVYADMTMKGVVPDEMFLSSLIDVAGHDGKVEAAFDILKEARIKGIDLGIVSYSSLMGACCNAKNWQKALELYEDIKSIKLNPTVSTINALITALCDGDQLHKAMEVLSEMKRFHLCPNTITYSVLMVESERNDNLEVGLMLRSQAKRDGITPNLIFCRCILGMCLRRFDKACKLGEPILSFNSGQLQIDNEWASLALMVYRESIAAGLVPTSEVLSRVLACLQLPYDTSLKSRLIENLGVSADPSRCSNLCSLVDGFGEYDPRAFSLLECQILSTVQEAASLGIVPCVSFKGSPIVVDARKLQIHTAEVYLLTVLKGLKYRLAAGAKLPNIIILLAVEKTPVQSATGEKVINLSVRVSQAVAALLRRLRLPYQGNESYGKIRINGLDLRRWFQPKLASPFTLTGEIGLSQLRLGKAITHQQRNIRTGNLSLE